MGARTFCRYKNATLSDLKRRFMNKGAEKLYAAFRRVNPSRLRLLAWAFHDLVASLTYKLRASGELVESRFFGKAEDRYNSELISSYYKSRCLYELRLICDNTLRELVEREDWIN